MIYSVHVMNNLISEKDKDKRLSEYIIDRILGGDVFFLGNENIVLMFEKENSIKFERTGINVKLRKYDKCSTLFFLKKDETLKNFSSDVYISAGANWETLFGFYFEDDLTIKIHVYFIGKEFDLDELSEMVYGLFSDTEEDHIKISNISYKYR